MARRAGLGAGQARPVRGDLGAGSTRGGGARPGAGRARAGRRGEGSRGIGLSPPLQGSWAARRDGADDGETGMRATGTRHSGHGAVTNGAAAVRRRRGRGGVESSGVVGDVDGEARRCDEDERHRGARVELPIQYGSRGQAPCGRGAGVGVERLRARAIRRGRGRGGASAKQRRDEAATVCAAASGTMWSGWFAPIQNRDQVRGGVGSGATGGTGDRVEVG